MGSRVGLAERKFRVSYRGVFPWFGDIVRDINCDIACKFDVGMPKKKLNYQQRWRLKHRPVTIYLSLEEYEALKQLADKTRLSYRELLYGAAKDIRKLYEELVREYADSYTNEIVKAKQDYEVKISQLKKDYEAKLSQLRQEYEAKLKEAYQRGVEDGKRKMKELIYAKCEVRCR